MSIVTEEFDNAAQLQLENAGLSIADDRMKHVAVKVIASF